jgi:ATP phosphoribosyltransferase
MSERLTIAIPSKGRLKEQAEDYLADCGFRLEIDGGARGYSASLKGLPGAEVRLLSASDIAAALDLGEIHLGVTGEDVIRERGGDVDARVMLLRALGFGRADLVVAAPQSWIDVETMADVAEVAHLYLARTSQRLRVATKYGVQTRAFFARLGIADYRIVDSAGATEGAPAAGAAELIVDITTTGATLAANNLKIVSDGVILKSQAQLAAALAAAWSPEAFAAARRLLRIVEGRGRAKGLSSIRWPAEFDGPAGRVTRPFIERGATRRSDGLLVPAEAMFDAMEVLADAEIGPVSVDRPDYVFEATSPVIEALAGRLGLSFVS